MFEEFIKGLQALQTLLAPIAQFVVSVHPANGQEQARANTAVATATSALQLAGFAAETINALHPTIASAAVMMAAQLVQAQQAQPPAQ